MCSAATAASHQGQQNIESVFGQQSNEPATTGSRTVNNRP